MKQALVTTIFASFLLGSMTASASWGQLRAGMTAKQVKKLIGSPKEIRQKNLQAHHHKEAYRWAYGLHAKGGFAKEGILIFSDQHKLLYIYRPTHASFFRAKVRKRLQRSQAERTQSGLQCELSFAMTKNHKKLLSQGQIPSMTVSLKNQGKQTFHFRHNHTAIHFNLVVELYNEKKQLLWQKDQITYHSPSSPKPKSQWPVISIAPGQKKSVTLTIYHALKLYGHLPRGSYFVRVGFPFQSNRFFRSNALSFQVR